MQLNWHIICSERSISRIRDAFPGSDLKVSRYWKDPECLELRCAYELDMVEKTYLIGLCRQISGMDQVQVDRQSAGTEYACYATLEEIRSGDKAFVVCFVNTKESEL